MTTIASVLNQIGVQGLYHGNVDTDDSALAQKEILALLQARGGGGLPKKKYPHQCVIRLPESNHVMLLPAKDPTDPNTAVAVYFQVSRDNTPDRVMVDLLMEMMYEPLYDQIRTKDQFGYHVSCDSRWTDGVIGMQMQVVTSSKTAQEADDRIEQFLTDFRQTLVEMTEESFMKHLVALAKQKLDMFHALSDETGHFWTEIRDCRYLWQVEREEVICLKSITKEQALKAYDELLWPESKKRRRMAVHVICSEGAASEGRPEVDQELVGDYIDDRVKEFHKYCKNQKFGKIY
jgi:nardilysin